MLVAFMDEFGHCGPFISRTHPKYNTSPVFGLAGYVMPHYRVRHFATFFIQLKTWMLADELRRVGQHPATWEKKGSELISTKNITKYRNVREGIRRFLNELRSCDANVVFYGREKYQSPEESKSKGLYSTVLSHTIRSINELCCRRNAVFMMILDQHPDGRSRPRC